MYLLFDIGGTQTRIAGTTDFAAFSEPKIIDTPQSYDEAMQAYADAATEATGGTLLKGVMIGTRRPDNILPQWRGKDIARDVAAAVEAPEWHLENDAALVGLGEAIFGAGQGAAVCAYYTVSTGVGGARIVNGHIDVSKHGFEVGGQYLTTTNPPTSLEELVSGTAISKRYGMHPKSIPKDDPVWEELARLLAIGVHNSVVHWAPDRVIIGGSMMNDIGIPIPRVQEHLKRLLVKFDAVPEVVHSSLGEVGGLWGGMARLRQLVQ